jgi:hypothetical protein
LFLLRPAKKQQTSLSKSTKNHFKKVPKIKQNLSSNFLKFSKCKREFFCRFFDNLGELKEALLVASVCCHKTPNKKLLSSLI